MLLGSAVKRESMTSSLGLLSHPSAFLSAGILAFLEVYVLSVQISVIQIKSVAFLRASARVFSFCSAKEDLNRQLFRLFMREVYATPYSKSGIKTAFWWKRLTNFAKDSYGSCLILDRWMLVHVSLLLAMN